MNKIVNWYHGYLLFILVWNWNWDKKIFSQPQKKISYFCYIENPSLANTRVKTIKNSMKFQKKWEKKWIKAWLMVTQGLRVNMDDTK